MGWLLVSYIITWRLFWTIGSNCTRLLPAKASVSFAEVASLFSELSAVLSSVELSFSVVAVSAFGDEIPNSAKMEAKLSCWGASGAALA